MTDVDRFPARSQYERLNDRYASDVTDGEFGLIEQLLPSAKRGGLQRTTDLREVLNAIRREFLTPNGPGNGSSAPRSSPT